MKAHSEMHPIRSSAPRETWLLNEIGLSRLRSRLRSRRQKPGECSLNGRNYRFRTGRDLDQRLSAAPEQSSTILRSLYPLAGPKLAPRVGRLGDFGREIECEATLGTSIALIAVL